MHGLPKTRPDWVTALKALPDRPDISNLYNRRNKKSNLNHINNTKTPAQNIDLHKHTSQTIDLHEHTSQTMKTILKWFVILFFIGTAAYFIINYVIIKHFSSSFANDDNDKKEYYTM